MFDLNLPLEVLYDDEPGHGICQLDYMRLVVL